MKSFLTKYLPFIALLSVLLSGCEKEYESIEVLDDQNIRDYIRQNSLSMQQYSNTGIYYQILSPGTGAVVDYPDQIFMNFSLATLDGKVKLLNDDIYRYTNYLGYLDQKNSSLPDAFRTAIKDILQRKGGSIRIIIPSRLAFGRNGNQQLAVEGNQSLDCTLKLYDVNNQIDFEDIFVKQYIQKNNIQSLTRTSTGLYYRIITPGTGTEPVDSRSTVTTNYVGKLTDGTIFDQSESGKTFVTSLTTVIPGWTQGVPFIKKGGKIRLIIPPALGYGSSATGKITPNSILDFEIELVDVTN